MTTKATWLAVAIYESTETRERAVAFCDRLVERFWAQSNFDVGWWSFNLLEEQAACKQAAEKAAVADLIILAACPEGDLPLHVRAWMESCLHQRGQREGALVALLEPTAESASGTVEKHLYLRHLAQRSGLDYLTQVPQGLSLLAPDSAEFYTERAHQVTSILHEILEQPAPPPRLASEFTVPLLAGPAR